MRTIPITVKTGIAKAGKKNTAPNRAPSVAIVVDMYPLTGAVKALALAAAAASAKAPVAATGRDSVAPTASTDATATATATVTDRTPDLAGPPISLPATAPMTPANNPIQNGSTPIMRSGNVTVTEVTKPSPNHPTRSIPGRSFQKILVSIKKKSFTLPPTPTPLSSIPPSVNKTTVPPPARTADAKTIRR